MPGIWPVLWRIGVWEGSECCCMYLGQEHCSLEKYWACCCKSLCPKGWDGNWQGSLNLYGLAVRHLQQRLSWHHCCFQYWSLFQHRQILCSVHLQVAVVWDEVLSVSDYKCPFLDHIHLSYIDRADNPWDSKDSNSKIPFCTYHNFCLPH